MLRLSLRDQYRKWYRCRFGENGIGFLARSSDLGIELSDDPHDGNRRRLFSSNSEHGEDQFSIIGAYTPGMTGIVHSSEIEF